MTKIIGYKVDYIDLGTQKMFDTIESALTDLAQNGYRYDEYDGYYYDYQNGLFAVIKLMKE